MIARMSQTSALRCLLLRQVAGPAAHNPGGLRKEN